MVSLAAAFFGRRRRRRRLLRRRLRGRRLLSPPLRLPWLVGTRAFVVFVALAAAPWRSSSLPRLRGRLRGRFLRGRPGPARPGSASAPVGPAGVRPLRSSSGPRNRPVWLSATAATCSGVPSATTMPPPLPPSGPMSMIQSAVLITSRLCSMTMTVLPLSTRPGARRAACGCPRSAGRSSARPGRRRCGRSSASAARWRA